MSVVRLSCPHCGAVVQVAAPPGSPDVVCPTCAGAVALPGVGPAERGYYYARQGEQFGPLSLVQLQHLVAQGQVLSSDWIWGPGAPEGTEAAAIPGLFPPAGPARPMAAPDLTDSEDIFDEPPDPGADDSQGPLSAKGMHACPGRSITLGDLQIVKKLGAGGMGAVYLAHQRSQDRPVALKVLARRWAARPAYLKRFYREASVLAGLEHPNIVGFYGAGAEAEFHYLAMEFVDGYSVAALLERRGGSLPVGDALHIVLACAGALGYAHDRQIVHRDVKPQNILITQRGHIKISDLGLAKPLDEDVSLTRTGTGLGTPQFVAPEQARNAKYADQRCDIYALGGVLYACLTGRLPFEGDNALALLQAKERGFYPPARRLNWAVPPRLDLIVQKMLAPDPGRRYQRCPELIRDLESLGLANAHLSFNPLRVERVAPAAPQEPPPAGRVEVLLVHDEHHAILSAQEALEERGRPSNLSVVASCREALASLRREGRYAATPTPNLLILAGHLLADGGLELIAAVRDDEALRAIPVVVLDSQPGSADVLEAHGLPVSLKVAQPDDLKQLRSLMQSSDDLSLTVVDLPPAP